MPCGGHYLVHFNVALVGGIVLGLELSQDLLIQACFNNPAEKVNYDLSILKALNYINEDVFFSSQSPTCMFLAPSKFILSFLKNLPHIILLLYGLVFWNVSWSSQESLQTWTPSSASLSSLSYPINASSSSSSLSLLLPHDTHTYLLLLILKFVLHFPMCSSPDCLTPQFLSGTE